MNELAAAIESFLLKQGAWVGSEDLCLIFHVELRATGEVPGLCSAFAISGTRGFRHIASCTEEEWQGFQARLRAHGIAELRRVRLLSRARSTAKPQLEMSL